MASDLIIHSASPNGLNERMDAVSNDLGTKVCGVLSETIERLIAPAAELESIKRKAFLTEREVALYFSVSSATLRTDRCKGTGPRYMKDGRKVLYSMVDLVNYYNGLLIKTRGSH